MTEELQQALAALQECREALTRLLGQTGNIEVLGEWSALDINPTSSRKCRAIVDAAIKQASDAKLRAELVLSLHREVS